jgi:sugar phosphate isomerase/epimerase
MDRRSFLLGAGAAGLAAAWSAARGADGAARVAAAAEPRPRDELFPIGSVGLQLYTVRTLMQQDVDRTLEQVAAAGYRIVETAGLFDRTPQAFRQSLDSHGLRSVSGHYSLEELERDPQHLFATARALGQQYVVVPSVPAALRSSPAAYVALADRFNHLGRACRDAGLRFAYHNHDAEFVTFGGATPAYDILLQHTDAALVEFELDVYWAYKAGQDPVRYFERYPGRFALCHLKDGTAPPERAMADVGAGTIDFRGLFRHARTAGLRYAFVEHDQPRDPVASIRASHDYLARLLGTAGSAGGWRSLFDGKTLAGWRGLGYAGIPAAHWTVENGTIKKIASGKVAVQADGQPVAGGDLMTVDTFRDFELAWDWKVTPGANSGVKYNVSEELSTTIPPAHAAKGFEYQMLDDDRHEDGKLPTHRAGALYDLIAPNGRKQLRPVGEWNHSVIVFDGMHGEHWLNGQKIVEYDLGSPAMTAALAASKFAPIPWFAERRTGHIVLQDHGDEVYFRNIRIREL